MKPACCSRSPNWSSWRTPRARSCTRMPHSRSGRLRSRCASWAWTCYPSPATSCTRRRASGRSMSGVARRWSPSCLVLATSADCDPERRTWPPSSGSAWRARSQVATWRVSRRRIVGLRDDSVGAARSGGARDPAQWPSHAAVAEHAQRAVPARLRQCNSARHAGDRRLHGFGLPCRGHESASAVILAMGVAADDAIGSIRLTLGRGTTSARCRGGGRCARSILAKRGRRPRRMTSAGNYCRNAGFTAMRHANATGNAHTYR